MKKDPKEEYVIPEAMTNVPLTPKQQLRIAARCNGIINFLLEQCPDEASKKEVKVRLKELEEEALQLIRDRRADDIRKRDFDSKFKKHTPEPAEEDTTPQLVDVTE